MVAQKRSLQRSIDRIHQMAIDELEKPRVSSKTKAALKKIAEEAMAVSQLLNRAEPKPSAFLKAARDFICRVVFFFRRPDDT
jgi:hypothetical protein